jgi:hypothetical protein
MRPIRVQSASNPRAFIPPHPLERTHARTHAPNPPPERRVLAAKSGGKNATPAPLRFNAA